VTYTLWSINFLKSAVIKAYIKVIWHNYSKMLLEFCYGLQNSVLHRKTLRHKSYSDACWKTLQHKLYSVAHRKTLQPKSHSVVHRNTL
jgi:hypothetical protein